MRASIQQFDLSGHANRDELADYAVQSQARAVVLTHGDTQARAWFSDALNQRMPDSKLLDPTPGVLYNI